MEFIWKIIEWMGDNWYVTPDGDRPTVASEG
jgi:hypothetical protein